MVTMDVDGNTVWDTNDKYGLIGSGDFLLASLYNGTGELSINKDEDGIPYFAASTSEKIADVISMILTELNAGAHIRLNGASNHVDTTTEFANNLSLFAATTLGRMTPLRTMEGDFGLLPFPKYDASQKQYDTRMVDGWLHVVPSTP